MANFAESGSARANFAESGSARANFAGHSPARAKAKAVFLDRDGTLNEDPGYLNHPDKMKLLPGVDKALSLLKEAGFELIVVSNQSGVGRGLISLDMLPKIHQRMDELLAPTGSTITHYEYCVHHPDDACECRKPKPKLILDAALTRNVDVSRSYMVGDKLTDVEVGRNARCKGVALVRTGSGRETEEMIRKGAQARPDFIGDSLIEVAQWILAQENAGS